MKITRGTTPTHEFSVPVAEEQIADLRITYRQRDGFCLTKTKQDCIFSEKQLQVRLTEEDTYGLDHRRPVRIQMKLLLTSGDVLASQILVREVGEILNEEVMQP